MEAWIKQLFEVAILSSVMIAAVLALRKIFRDRLTVSVVSLLWLLVMIRLLMPISLEAPVHINIPLPQSAVEPAVQTEVDYTGEPVALETGVFVRSDKDIACRRNCSCQNHETAIHILVVPAIHLAVAVWRMGGGCGGGFGRYRSQDCDVRAEDQKAESAFGKNRGPKGLPWRQCAFVIPQCAGV